MIGIGDGSGIPPYLSTVAQVVTSPYLSWGVIMEGTGQDRIKAP